MLFEQLGNGHLPYEKPSPAQTAAVMGLLVMATFFAGRWAFPEVASMISPVATFVDDMTQQKSMHLPLESHP